MNITVWGNELIAWTTAASLAKHGNRITMVPDAEATGSTDLDQKVHNEPGLLKLLEDTIKSGHLKVVTADEGLHAQRHFFAFSPNKSNSATLIASQLSNLHPVGLWIINQSNFGVGSTDQLQSLLREDKNQYAAYMPDMLSEGSALSNFQQPETLIIGCCNEAANEIKAIMRPFCHSLCQWLQMTPKEAEFTKFANTGMLALRLGYINELANIADELDVDIEVVRNGLGSDPRIGRHYLNPGCGFGGLHFQQYVEGLSGLMSDIRSSKLLDTVLRENDKQKEQPFRKLWRHYNCNLQGLTISIWGLSFKPGTASVDNAPSLKVVEALLAQDCKVQLHDPEATGIFRRSIGDHSLISYHQDPYEALESSDALLLLTEWPEYSSPDIENICSRMKQRVIVDGRNHLDKQQLEQQGFSYYGVGR